MNGGIPSRTLLNAGDTPFDLREKIGRKIEPYSIMPLLNGEVSGSGTPVTIDGVRGILTARRVVRNWHGSKPKSKHTAAPFPLPSHASQDVRRCSYSSASSLSPITASIAFA